MKNKWAILAGVGLGAALTLSVLSFSSANETVDVTTAATNTATVTKTVMPFTAGKMMKVMHAEGGMMAGKNGMFMVRFGGTDGENSAMHDAVMNGDYNAFVALWNADENKPEDATVPTEEMFNQMVSAHKKQMAIETALETNDYDGYVKATTPTRDEFTAMSEMHNQQKAIHEAIQAKDYDAFVTAAKNTPMADMTEEEFNKMGDVKMVRFEKFEKRAGKMNEKIKRLNQ